MYSLNRVQLIGYQTQPVSVRQTPSGMNVTDLNLVVPVSFRTESGEMLSGKSFHTVTLWGALAQVAGQFLRPGGQVFVAGRLQTDSWEDEKSGEKRSRTKVIASEFILLDPKGGQLPPPSGAKSLLSCCNRVDLVGNVTRDPEMRTTTSGQKVLSLGVATNEKWKDKASGEMKERTEFHNVAIWGELAEEVSQCMRKGYRVYVSGRVQTRSWETQSGAKRATTEVVAETVSLLGIKSQIAEESLRLDDGSYEKPVRAAEPAGAAEPAYSAVPDISYNPEIKVEDLPF